MKLHSTTFWEKSPLLIRQTPPRMHGFTKDINKFLYFILGIPFFQFYVLETLIKNCEIKLKTSRERVVIVNVCFSEQIVNRMMQIFDSKKIIDEKDFLSKLSVWLTEQISARLFQEKNLHMPAIYARCVKVDKAPADKDYQIVKSDGVDLLTRKLLARFNYDHRTDVDFFLLFPRPNHSHKITVSIKTPLLSKNESRFEFETLKTSFGKKDIFLSDKKKVDRICQLVADDHVEFALSHDEDSGCDYAWIKHLGVHETWLVKTERTNDGINFENWILVAENSWAIVEPDVVMVLGRIAEVDVDGVQRKIVLPGSLVITLEY